VGKQQAERDAVLGPRFEAAPDGEAGQPPADGLVQVQRSIFDGAHDGDGGKDLCRRLEGEQRVGVDPLRLGAVDVPEPLRPDEPARTDQRHRRTRFLGLGEDAGQRLADLGRQLLEGRRRATTERRQERQKGKRRELATPGHGWPA
jgi:hypothetical protein